MVSITLPRASVQSHLCFCYGKYSSSQPQPRVHPTASSSTSCIAATSHTFTVVSDPAAAMYLPSGDHPIALIRLGWQGLSFVFSNNCFWPLATSDSSTPPSGEAVDKRLPTGDHASRR